MAEERDKREKMKMVDSVASSFCFTNSHRNLTCSKRSSIIEARRAVVLPEVRRRVDFSFLIVDRINAILEQRGLKQKDLATMLDKKESEVSKWMRGTHNFTIETITRIEKALGEPILQVVGV